MTLNGNITVRRTDCRLCYVRAGTADRRRAASILADLGLEPVVQGADQALFRSDGRHHTLALVAEDMEAIGIEVADLGAVAARMNDAGFAAREATAAECDCRHVRRALFTCDASGNAIELVLRPSQTGRRFFPPRDAGVTGLRAVALRSLDIARDTRFWTEGLGAEVADWVGDITYLRLDGVHHQIALYPSDRPGILYHSYGVTDLDAIMRGFYSLSEQQVEIVHGPGCETASGDIFLRVRIPGGAVVAFVAPGGGNGSGRPPRQFERTADALCSWGSRCEALPELCADAMR